MEFLPESGGTPTVFATPGPSRPGAFRVEDAAPAAGRFRLAVALESSGLADRHDLGLVIVYPDEAATRAATAGESADEAVAIAYLKEQQWTNAFETAPVREADVRPSMLAPATVRALPGGDAIVTAPAAGRSSRSRPTCTIP